MDFREGFRRIARVTAWLYWICALLLAIGLASDQRAIPRSDFTLTGPDGQVWEVSGYDQAKAQAFLNRSVAPKPKPKPKTLADMMGGKEESGSPDPWEAAGAVPAYESKPAQIATPSTPGFMTDDEPNREDAHGARDNAFLELGVAFVVYLIGVALFRALRWIARGFLGDGPTAEERATAAQNQRTLDGILNYRGTPGA